MNLPFGISKELGLLVCIVISMLVVGAIVGGVVSAVKNSRHQKIVDDLKIERQKDIERGDAAEQRATKAEADKVELQIAVELAGERGAAALKRVNDAEEKFNQELQSIDAPADACQRYTRLRARLGLRQAPCTE